MATTQLAFLAIAVLLLQASLCAVSQQDAVMAETSFDVHGGNGPSSCDGGYHWDGGHFAALPTKWYAGGSRCGKYISITSKDTGRTVKSLVIDECDDCDDNLIPTSPYTWVELGFDDSNVGEVAIVWSEA